MTDCICGHGASWHNHCRFAGTYCTLCARCGRTQRQHDTAFGGHNFTQCNCKGQIDGIPTR